MRQWPLCGGGLLRGVGVMAAGKGRREVVRTGSDQQRHGAKQRRDSLPHSRFTRHFFEGSSYHHLSLVVPSPYYGELNVIIEASFTIERLCIV